MRPVPLGLGRTAGGILLCVGFNPYRPHHRSRADYLFVAAAAVACLALLAWAVLG
jgi:hypothetical protein